MLSGNTFGGNVGLAISQVLILCGMLQYGMRQTAETITQMTCVERIFQFTQLEKEGPFESEPGQKPPSSWPAKGQIKFDHVYLYYSNTDAPILKDLNFVIKPGTKVISDLPVIIRISYEIVFVSSLINLPFIN